LFPLVYFCQQSRELCFFLSAPLSFEIAAMRGLGFSAALLLSRRPTLQVRIHLFKKAYDDLPDH